MTFFFPIPKSGATESHPDRAWAAGKLGIIEQCFATVAFISTIALPDLNGTMYIVHVICHLILMVIVQKQHEHICMITHNVDISSMRIF